MTKDEMRLLTDAFAASEPCDTNKVAHEAWQTTLDCVCGYLHISDKNKKSFYWEK